MKATIAASAMLMLVCFAAGCAADGYWRKEGGTRDELVTDYSECSPKGYFASRRCMREKGYVWTTEGNRKYEVLPGVNIPVGPQKHIDHRSE